jgi:hypothetical protein
MLFARCREPLRMATSFVPRSMSSTPQNAGRLLFVVQAPETVDFSEPALPPGLDAEKLHARIAVGLGQMVERGWNADLCLVRPDATAPVAIKRQLATATYDCVVVGGAIRLPARNSPLFEMIVDAVRKSAPRASISFNTRAEDAENLSCDDDTARPDLSPPPALSWGGRWRHPARDSVD